MSVVSSSSVLGRHPAESLSGERPEMRLGSNRPPPHASLATVEAGQPFEAAAHPRLRDYFIVLKPRVMALVVFTALVGMSLASSLVSGGLLAPAHLPGHFISLFAIAVGAGASGGLNMWYERRLDGLMRRTQSRPLPQGRVSSRERFNFFLSFSRRLCSWFWL